MWLVVFPNSTASHTAEAERKQERENEDRLGRVVVIALVPGKTPVKQEQTLPEQGLPGDAYTVNLVVD